MFRSQGLGNNQLSKHSPSDLRVNCFVWGDFFSVVCLCHRNWICLKSQGASAGFDRVQHLKYSCSAVALHPVSAPRSSAHLYHKRLRERDQAWTLTFWACSTVRAQVSEGCAEIRKPEPAAAREGAHAGKGDPLAVLYLCILNS